MNGVRVGNSCGNTGMKTADSCREKSGSFLEKEAFDLELEDGVCRAKGACIGKGGRVFLVMMEEAWCLTPSTLLPPLAADSLCRTSILA